MLRDGLTIPENHASDVFAQEVSRTTAQNKNILMVFRASWCEFCSPLGDFLDAPEIRPIMDKYFVRADLAVDEEAHGKPYLNNPGAEDFWIKAGARGHVPFIVIYDSQGEPIVTSNRQSTGGNIGYPARPVEIDWFVYMLEESARSAKALLRCRNVPDAAALIRMALAYAVSDLSLKDVAAWASALEVAQITGPGLFYRLREAEGWLERVLGQVLADQVPQAAGGWPVRAVDATVLNGPGKKRIQWRAHVQIDPSTGAFRAVELTDDSGGEKLGRHHFRAGEVVLGDRAYATARGIHSVRQADAHVIVRFNPGNLRTCDEQRRRVHLAEREVEIPVLGLSNITS